MTLMGRGDLDDQRWLDQQVATLGDGIEAARAIWLNWSDLRNVGRLHPGRSAGQYIASLGLRLTVAEAMAALPDGSLREVAAVAGVSHETVRAVKNLTPVPLPSDSGYPYRETPEPPARVIGADGKSYPGRVVGTTTAEVIEEDQEVNLSELDEVAIDASYIRALSDYIAGIIRVQPPTLGDPPALFRRRHELERRLQTVLAEVMTTRPATQRGHKENSDDTA